VFYTLCILSKPVRGHITVPFARKHVVFVPYMMCLYNTNDLKTVNHRLSDCITLVFYDLHESIVHMYLNIHTLLNIYI